MKLITDGRGYGRNLRPARNKEGKSRWRIGQRDREKLEFRRKERFVLSDCYLFQDTSLYTHFLFSSETTTWEKNQTKKTHEGAIKRSVSLILNN